MAGVTTKLKNRINISAPQPVRVALERLARRDDVPVATKTLELVKRALEQEEDFALAEIAKKREEMTTKWLGHKSAWRRTK
jgi:hypothetical protein